jgi:hypothetical protein
MLISALEDSNLSVSALDTITTRRRPSAQCAYSLFGEDVQTAPPQPFRVVQIITRLSCCTQPRKPYLEDVQTAPPQPFHVVRLTPDQVAALNHENLI